MLRLKSAAFGANRESLPAGRGDRAVGDARSIFYKKAASPPVKLLLVIVVLKGRVTKFKRRATLKHVRRAETSSSCRQSFLGKVSKGSSLCKCKCLIRGVGFRNRHLAHICFSRPGRLFLMYSKLLILADSERILRAPKLVGN